MTIQQRKQELLAELCKLEEAEKLEKWAKEELEKYSNSEKRLLYGVLLQWLRDQIGHDSSCHCGECD